MKLKGRHSYSWSKLEWDKTQGLLTVYNDTIHNENNDIDYAFHIKGVKNDTDIKKIKFKGTIKIYGSASALFNGLN